MLLKGKYDDQLKWPMNLQYKLEIRIEEPRRTTIKGKRAFITPKQVRTVQLSNLVRVTSACKEIVDIDLPVRELLNYELIVKLIPAKVSPQAATAAIPLECPTCFQIINIPDPGEFCCYCGSIL